ncbi:YkgJ family cysteine cluster protein [Paenibacillus wulumuqiensis]|uniref:YkgJ family cysteine cluster protein n=1 Tax=Paenibacillus wulumuqiensis TaxID=1567107 RepID=UPI001F1CB8D7|nr:YkgJ family cysteine cluster protein [Paenibacillus wulumuqiensis]
MEKDRCGIHSARPGVCRAFGYYKTLVCFRKSEMATQANWSPADKPVSILSIDITWQAFEITRGYFQRNWECTLVLL